MTEPTQPAPHAVPSGLLHDLRTPLNQIIGYSEMLIEQSSADSTTDVQKIRAAGHQLLAVINANFSPTTAPASSLRLTPRDEEPAAETGPEESKVAEPS